jgi:spermidine synthase
MLALHIGHSTAAASAVVAAFLGGLAVGAARGGVVASRLSPRQALVWYAWLELAVAGLALLLPFEIRAFVPLLSWAYQDGAPSFLFPAILLLACLSIVFVPATALGATFPMAVRWFADASGDRARAAGTLYALNTTGAAAGALLAGFGLIPLIGVSGTTLVGVCASVAAATSVGLIARRTTTAPVVTTRRETPRVRHQRWRPAVPASTPEPQWLAAAVLGLSGCASLMHEIAWTRVLTMLLGPTIYAFAGALTAVIIGIALGSAGGTAVVARSRRPAMWLAVTLALAAAVGIWTSSLAGGPIPRAVAAQIAETPNRFDELLVRGGLLTAALIVPMNALLGAAFPLALAMIVNPSRSAAREAGSVYAINTVGAVVGSLGAGFIVIPALGLEATLKLVTVCLIVAAALVLGLATIPRNARLAGACVSVAAVAVMALSAPWDRELLASGAYLYAPFVPKGVDLEAMLKAGTLQYYREGASATISVKRLTGTLTLTVDGKTDASNRGDMLTQKLVAHLPLLLHEQPRTVAVVGLGSGVTVGAVLRHPIARADVLEISPEVVAASQLFVDENRHAVADERTHVIVGDGRSHLQLSRRKYDVIISEPSNPWIAGVAALFTREFFTAARDRLAPGGLICQWANAYNISDRDLRSIVATFLSVFPDGTAWLVGADDVVLLASDGPLDERLKNIEQHWSRTGVGEDLATVAAVEPFSLQSLFVAGPRELSRYARQGEVLTDDRMTVEFSGPRDVHGRGVGENGAALRALLDTDGGPAIIRAARVDAGPEQWRRRGAMMAARDAYTSAYEDYKHALTLDPANAPALDGLVRTAVLTHRGGEALDALNTLMGTRDVSAQRLVAASKLLASAGSRPEALDAATRAADLAPANPAALEQLASLCADSGDGARSEAVLSRMRASMPDHAATAYYEGVAAFLRGDVAEARRHSERAIAIDGRYAAAYDLLGAALTRLGDIEPARAAFLKSLSFDAHDSTAYANLGVLALNQGMAAAATDYFAEALWLDADSALARDGLARSLRFQSSTVP